MKCKKCGTENSEESESCSKCGKSFKAKNIYSKIGLLGFFIAIILEVIAVLTNSFICALIVLILSIISLIISICGIVKSVKLKKQIGKLKGMVISIISILLFFIISFFNIPMIAFTNTIAPNLSNQEKAIYDSVKALPSTLNVPESFRLYNVYLYQFFNPEYKEGKEPEPLFGFSIIIEYGGENKMGGVSRNYYVVGFKNNVNSFNEDIEMGECKNFSDYYEADEFARYEVALSKNSHKNIKVIKLDTNAIEKYINKK